MNRNTIYTLFSLLVLAVAGLLWYRYMRSSPEGGAAAGADQARFARTLGQVRRLQQVDIDTSLFQERFFRELVPPKEIPRPEAKPGRENPFTPFR